MTEREIELLITSSITDAEAEVSIEGNCLYVSAAFEAHNSKEAGKIFYNVILKNPREQFAAIQFKWFPSKAELSKNKIRTIVEATLQPIREYISEINVEVSRSAVTVRVTNSLIHSLDKIHNAPTLIRAVEKAITQTSGSSSTVLNVITQKSTLGFEFNCNHSADDNEDYDDDDDSPNWPSKTGNPSGGGRDNNPPGR